MVIINLPFLVSLTVTTLPPWPPGSRVKLGMVFSYRHPIPDEFNILSKQAEIRIILHSFSLLLLNYFPLKTVWCYCIAYCFKVVNFYSIGFKNNAHFLRCVYMFVSYKFWNISNVFISYWSVDQNKDIHTNKSKLRNISCRYYMPHFCWW